MSLALALVFASESKAKTQASVRLNQKHKLNSKSGAFGMKNDWDKVAKAAEVAKHNIINNYYAIGIVEQFDESLDLFEKLLPDFFTGAKERVVILF